MIEKEFASIQNIIIHKVGNKSNDEGLYLSNSYLKINDEINGILLNFLLTPFKNNEYYNFYHKAQLYLNTMYHHAVNIFDNPFELQNESIKIAEHLYNQSTHPKIKTGELYITYIKNCVVDGEYIDAIGIFKTESKETYLKLRTDNNNFIIESDIGINLNKLDKGCLIFNTEKHKGFLIAVVDNLNKGVDARYWLDDFLQVKQHENEYYQTQNTMQMCKSFVVKHLPEEFEIEKTDQIDVLNKSVNFFKEKDEFKIEEFADEVLQSPELISTFKEYKEQYEQEKDITIANEFNISEDAVKKQSRVFKSVIKLDKNFHIYVHGNQQYIQKGYDEDTGMQYYQLFYKTEN